MCASVYANKGGRNEDDTRHDRGRHYRETSKTMRKAKNESRNEEDASKETCTFVWLSNHTHRRVDVVTRESRHLRDYERRATATHHRLFHRRNTLCRQDDGQR